MSRLPLVREIGEYACQRKSSWVVQELKKKICCMYEKVICINLYDLIEKIFFTWALRSCLTVSCTKTSAKVLKSWTNRRFFWSPAFSWTSNSSNADSARMTLAILAPFSEAFTSAWSKLRAGTFIFSQILDATFLVPSCSLQGNMDIFPGKIRTKKRRLYSV